MKRKQGRIYFPEELFENMDEDKVIGSIGILIGLFLIGLAIYGLLNQ